MRRASLLEQDMVLCEIVDRLVAELHPERIYLFGSRARGDARPDSDYDLLVVVRERTGEGREMEQRVFSAMWGLHAPVDIVVMTADYFDWMLDAAASLPAMVQHEGRLLHHIEAGEERDDPPRSPPRSPSVKIRRLFSAEVKPEPKTVAALASVLGAEVRIVPRKRRRLTPKKETAGVA